MDRRSFDPAAEWPDLRRDRVLCDLLKRADQQLGAWRQLLRHAWAVEAADRLLPAAARQRAGSCHVQLLGNLRRRLLDRPTIRRHNVRVGLGTPLEAVRIEFKLATHVPALPEPLHLVVTQDILQYDTGATEDLSARNAQFLQKAQAGHYDFLDLGTLEAGGFAVGYQLGGTHGLGMDIDAEAVRKNIAAGRDVMCADITTVGAMKLRAKLAVCHHVLEHLASIHEVGHVIRALSLCCSEFLFIAGPCFDYEDYLYSCGLKALQSAMPDHTCRFRSFDLIRLLHELGLRHFAIGVSLPIPDSDNQFLVRADAPNEVWRWEALRALPRPRVTFEPVLYRDIVCVVALSKEVDPVDKLNAYSFGGQVVDRVVEVADW
jgi:hypothetical protein